MKQWTIGIGKRCVACGECMNVCPRGAIQVMDGIRAVVNETTCVGCGLCVNTCPAGIIKRVKNTYE